MRVSHRLKIVSWLLLLLACLAASGSKADSGLANVFKTRLAIPLCASREPDLGSRWAAEIEWTWMEFDEFALPESRGAALSTTTSVTHRLGRWQAGLSLQSLYSLRGTSVPFGDMLGVEVSTGIDLSSFGRLQTIWLGEKVSGDPVAMTVLIRWSGAFAS